MLCLQLPINVPLWLNSVEHVTLDGGLIVAVMVLWKQFSKKDDLLVESTRTVTEALQGAAASNAELRRVIDKLVEIQEDSADAKRELAGAITELRMAVYSLPCTDDKRLRPRDPHVV